jgi:hypothetical protein
MAIGDGFSCEMAQNIPAMIGEKISAARNQPKPFRLRRS